MQSSQSYDHRATYTSDYDFRGDKSLDGKVERMKKIAIAVLAALVLLGSAAVATAQESPSKAPEDKQKEDGRERRERFKAKRQDGFRMIHSDGVAMKADGTTVEARFQKGIITAVSSEEITLESPDDYVETYIIDGDTKVFAKRQKSSSGELKVGEVANVRGVKSGDDYLARFIRSGGEPGPRLKEFLEQG